MNDTKIVLAHLNVINIGEQYYKEGKPARFLFQGGLLLLLFFISYFMSSLMVAAVTL